MDSLPFKYNVEGREGKPLFYAASDSQSSTTSESFTAADRVDSGSSTGSAFSPLAAPFQSRVSNDLLTLMPQQEPRAAETAPSAVDMEDVLMNLRLNSELLLNDADPNPRSNYFMGGNRVEPPASTNFNIWGDGNGRTVESGARNGEMIETFDFLIKSLSSANNYVSMLTREQLSVLRSIRPSLLYELLQEVSKVRSDRRMRRALPNECAFCKNNGENEESYSSHALKDWRGRVLCPVLRAFRCPRCGATGDRAHTIKYCPENIDNGLERSGSLLTRRRSPSSLSIATTRGSASSAPATPAPSLSPSSSAFSHSSLWSTFGMN